MKLSRRRVLRAASVAGTVAIAGCSADSGADDGTEGADGEAPGNDSAGNDAAGSDGADDGSGEEPSSPEAAARQFTDRLFGGEYEAAVGQFADAYADGVSAPAVERTRLGFEAALGSFDGIESVETGVHSGFQSVELTYGFEAGTADLAVLTTDDAELAGYAYASEYEQADYVDPDAFEASEHTLEPEGCLLDATLTVPAGDESAPGVVLVHGSQPADRDLTTGANAFTDGVNKPYRDLAEGLASRGVAVLRYDLRTFACEVPAEEQTIDHVWIDDALHALDWLRDADGVDADRLAVVGHSLGGALAPEIARRDGDVAGAVGLAAPARPLEEVFLDQVEHLAEVGELTMDAVEQRRERWQNAAEQLRSGEYEPDEVLLNHPGAFWSSLEGYDPVETARALDAPQAYHQGGRDYQVTVEADFAQWRDAFADDDSVALAEHPELNHALMPGHGPQVPEAYAVPNQVAEAVVTDLADWIRAEL